MKAKYVLIAAVLVACVVSPLLARGRTPQTLRRAVPPALSVQQKADLAFLREEEKLARDVYFGMFDLWGARIFSNISVSEQRHMDAVKGLFDKYGLPDPVRSKGVGVFTNTELQELYDRLIARGSVSYQMALRVGVAIEEMDIEDINMMFSHATQPDVLQVLSNLRAGSYNHLAAFEKVLAALCPE